jgi:hypothetical protein
MTIDNQQVVALNYVLHTDGENNEKVLVEKSDAGNPLTFLYGVGMMIPKFEESIKGLTSGDKASRLLVAGRSLFFKMVPCKRARGIKPIKLVKLPLPMQTAPIFHSRAGKPGLRLCLMAAGE